MSACHEESDDPAGVLKSQHPRFMNPNIPPTKVGGIFFGVPGGARF